MALVVTTIQADIKAILLENCPEPTSEQSSQIDAFASKLATAIDKYIKTATITAPNGPCTIL